MSLDIGQLIGWAITLLGIFTTLVFGLFKLLLRGIENRLDERSKVQDAAHEKMLARQDRDGEAVRQLENDFLRWQADLPLHYVRREDWVRNQSVIEAKLDGLAMKLENVQLKGARND